MSIFVPTSWVVEETGSGLSDVLGHLRSCCSVAILARFSRDVVCGGPTFVRLVLWRAIAEVGVSEGG